MKMTGSKILLDTNIISALFKGELEVAQRIDNAEEVYIPIIALGELHFGAAQSMHYEKNSNDINDLILRYPISFIEVETTITYGNIKASLKRKGNPIPENHIWIGAIGICNDFTVISRDKHFDEIDGLRLEKW
jgi:tRNA(fMet)-specific endonuclease VapC